MTHKTGEARSARWRGVGSAAVSRSGIRQASAVYLLALIFLLYGLWIPSTFFTTVTFRAVGAGQVSVALLALAVLVPLISGAYDLSVGGIMAFSLAILTWLVSNASLNIVVCCLIALAASAGAGFINGAVVVMLGVDSFIATLGTSQILLAAGLFISQNREMVGTFSNTFLSAGQRTVMGVPITLYYLVAVALGLWYVLARTPLGRNLFATGANKEAARLAGVRVDRLIWGSMIASGAIAGAAGVIFAASVGVYSNTVGVSLIFPAFAAVFLGATQFSNRPNVWGTLLAVYTLAFGVEGLQLAVSTGVYWLTPLFNGAALVTAVAVHSSRRGFRLPRSRAGKSSPEALSSATAIPDDSHIAYSGVPNKAPVLRESEGAAQ
jgi:ribose transport system permease protein